MLSDRRLLPLALAALLAAGPALAEPPVRLVEIQRLAWVEHAYEVRPGDWRAMWHGDCRNKALKAKKVLAAEGWLVGARTGCRADRPGHVRDGQCNLAAYQQGRIANPVHMVPVVAKDADGPWYVIDQDRVWQAELYPLIQLEHYDWRIAAAASTTR